MPASRPTAVNLITGPLGSGKTTLITQLIQQKPVDENWTLLVNEFGALGIDGAILSSHDTVNSIQLPGGCICCTAKAELRFALNDILQTRPDRLLIEPTGLGEPDTLVDLLQSFAEDASLVIETLYTVLDSHQTDLESIQRYTFMQNLLSMADVIVLNKQDLADPERIHALKTHCQQLYPPKQAVLTTQNSRIDASTLSNKHLSKPSIKTSETAAHTHANREHPVSAILDFGVPVERRIKQENGVLSVGYLFAEDLRFDWKRLFKLFETLTQIPGLKDLKRAKGVFRVGTPSMLFQWSHHQATREYIAYRRDSRVELLVPMTGVVADEPPPKFDLRPFEQHLKNGLQNLSKSRNRSDSGD